MKKLFSWKNPISWPLAMRLVLCVGVLLLVAVWGGIYYTANSIKESSWQNACTISAQAAKLAAERTSIYLRNAEKLVRYLRRHIETNASLPPLAPLFSEHEDIYCIYRVFADGRIENPSGDEKFYIDNFPAQHGEDGKDLRIGKAVWNPFRKCWTVPVSMPLMADDGSFDGVVTVVVDGFVFSDEFNRIDLPFDAKVILVGDDYSIRAVNLAAIDYLFLGTTADKSFFNELFSNEKPITIACRDQAAGSDDVTSGCVVPDFPLAVKIDIPRAELLPDETDLEKRALFFALFGSWLVIAAATAALRGLRIRQKAIEAIERSRDELQATVEERTKELREANDQLTERTEQLAMMNDQLRDVAYYEQTTGLPNRYMLMEYLTEELNGGGSGCLVAVNHDNLRIVSNVFGREAASGVLSRSATRLVTIVPKGSFLAHFGESEFYLVCPGENDREALGSLMKDLCEAFRHEQSCEGIAIAVTASLGGAIYPDDGSDPLLLLQSADSAMLQAKKNGKDSWAVFTQEMKDALYDDVALTHEMKKALPLNEFSLVFQPQVDCATHAVRGYESLIRWKNPFRGFVSPGRFIPLAERNNLIQPIGKWVCGEACKFIKRLEADGHNDIRVSINVSALQLARPDFIESMDEIIAAHGVNPSQVEIEITETMLMTSLDLAVDKLTQVRSRGIRIAIDDFGTGYSSLSYLRKIPFDTLKIDKSFIDSLPDDEEGSKIVNAIVFISHVLGKEVVVEGVETAEQLECLHAIGSDIIQGYYFSRPLPSDEAIDYLEQNAKSGLSDYGSTD